MYDATLGRFLQRDPMAVGSNGFGPTNVYSYVLDSPTNGIDPRGLAPFTWKYRLPSDQTLNIKGADGKVTKTYPLSSGRKQYGLVTVIATVKDGQVTMELKYEAKGEGKCPCAGNLGWVQHVTDPISGDWRYDNAASIPERQDGEKVIPGKGETSTPGTNPKDFTSRPKEGAWKSNPWYGGFGNVTALLKKEKKYKPLEWTNSPRPQTEINDEPAKGARLAFIDQLVCEATGDILFDYAWMQNVKTTDDTTYTFFGARPFYGSEFGKKGTGLMIKPGAE
jgi:hypothetical protein